jgi:hypothetical protein
MFQILVVTAGYVPLVDWQHAQAVALAHNAGLAQTGDALHQASLSAMAIRFDDAAPNDSEDAIAA